MYLGMYLGIYSTLPVRFGPDTYPTRGPHGYYPDMYPPNTGPPIPYGYMPYLMAWTPHKSPHLLTLIYNFYDVEHSLSIRRPLNNPIERSRQEEACESESEKPNSDPQKPCQIPL